MPAPLPERWCVMRESVEAVIILPGRQQDARGGQAPARRAQLLRAPDRSGDRRETGRHIRGDRASESPARCRGPRSCRPGAAGRSDLAQRWGLDVGDGRRMATSARRCEGRGRSWRRATRLVGTSGVHGLEAVDAPRGSFSTALACSRRPPPRLGPKGPRVPRPCAPCWDRPPNRQGSRPGRTQCHEDRQDSMDAHGDIGARAVANPRVRALSPRRQMVHRRAGWAGGRRPIEVEG